MARMMTKVDCSTLSWEQIRTHLINDADSLRGRGVDSDTFNAIVQRRTAKLSKRLQRELSVFILGYTIAKT
jgi:hypothetical protein